MSSMVLTTFAALLGLLGAAPAYERLSNATEFAFSDGSYGCLSDEAFAFMRLVDGGAVERFVQLSDSQSKAAQLYALCGLQALDANRAAPLRTALSTDARKVVVSTGCGRGAEREVRESLRRVSMDLRSDFDVVCEYLTWNARHRYYSVDLCSGSVVPWRQPPPDLRVYRHRTEFAHEIGFRSGGTDVAPGYRQGIDGLAATLRMRSDIRCLELVGHRTQNEPTAIAEMRAAAVKQSLEARGVPSNRLRTTTRAPEDDCKGPPPACRRRPRSVTFSIVEHPR